MPASPAWGESGPLLVDNIELCNEGNPLGKQPITVAEIRAECVIEDCH